MKVQYVLDEDKKANISTLAIILVSLYLVWQMGVMFFSGNSLVLSNRVLLNIDSSLTAIVLALGYLITIVFHYFFSKQTILVGKIALFLSFFTSIVLFLPISTNILSVAFYLCAFLCTFLIGTTYSIEIGLYDSKTVLKSNFIGTFIGCVLISIVQSDFFNFPFWIFNAISILLLAGIILGYFMLPKKIETKKIGLREAHKNNNISKSMLAGLFLSPFISTLIFVFSCVIAQTVKHGLFIFYLCGALGTAIWFLLFKKFKINPFKLSAISFSLSMFGFLCGIISFWFSGFVYPAIVLTSTNILIANLIGFFGNTAFSFKPTNLIVVSMPICGFIVALIQFVLLEKFRNNLLLLFAIISVLVFVLIIFYILIEPVLSYKFKKLASKENKKTENELQKRKNNEDVFNSLNERDRQIVEYILCGYTSPEIAKAMFYSVDSIKTYKKNIYAKLDIHTKKELFILANKR